MTAGPADARRTARHQLGAGVPVVDAMSNRALGFVRNLSQGGMQLVASSPLVNEALYQVLFELEGAEGRVSIEAGVQALGQRREGRDVVVGMRFIHLDPANASRMVQWLAAQNAGPR